jgi:hypothetical protein
MSEPLDDLRAALGSIEPSPAFEKQTFVRIERERATTARRAWMFLAPVAAAAVVIAAIAVKPAGDVKPADSARVEAAAASAEPAPISVPARQPEPVTRVNARPMHRAHAAQPAALDLTIPENAHADQVFALRRLMTLIRAGKATVPDDSTIFDDSGPVPVLVPVELKPILIAPLSSGQGGGSER